MQTGVEFALVDQASGLVDYYEGVDGPDFVSVCAQIG